MIHSATMKRTRVCHAHGRTEDYLDEFNVDNDGDLVFAKIQQELTMKHRRSYRTDHKQAHADSLISELILAQRILLDEIHIKVDNLNKRISSTSFYYKQRRGNVEGFYFYIWDKQSKNDRNAEFSCAER